MPNGDFCASGPQHSDHLELGCGGRVVAPLPSPPAELPPSAPPQHFLGPPPMEGPAYGPSPVSAPPASTPTSSAPSSTSSSSGGSTTSKRPTPKAPLRKGKWTPEEEVYAHYIIDNFNKGLINLPRGTTLRSYLSEKLNCDPMRVTKKFSGTSCIGKSVFCPCEPTPENQELLKQVGDKLSELEKDFRTKVEHQSASPHIDGLLRSIGRSWLGPLKMSDFPGLEALKPALKFETLGRPPRPVITDRLEAEMGGFTMRNVLPPPPGISHHHHHHHLPPPVPSTASRMMKLEASSRSAAPPSECNGSSNGAVKRSRSREGPEDFSLTDQDAGDLLFNFFASVHRTYAAEEGGSASGSNSDGEPGECWASYKTHELAAEPDLVTQALKRQKVIDGC